MIPTTVPFLMTAVGAPVADPAPPVPVTVPVATTLEVAVPLADPDPVVAEALLPELTADPGPEADAAAVAVGE